MVKKMAAAEASDKIIVFNGVEIIREIVSEYLKILSEYNKLVYKMGYYLKPKHVVYKKTSMGRVKYVYYGRYWWKLAYDGKRGKTSRVKWIYIGLTRPEGVPNPPENPLEGLKVRIAGCDVVLDREVYERFKDYFRGLKKAHINS